MRVVIAHRPLVLLLAVVLVSGCNRARGGDSSASANEPVPSAAKVQQVPLGAGPGEVVSPASTIKNPLENDPQAVTQGAALFASMNCVYCHGAQASGLMGPALNAPGWRYGGTPVQIYNSIHDGRPQGMPSWRTRLTPTQIWQLVAYIESLGGASPPATAKIAAQSQPSTTGPQAAGQSQTDSSDAGLKAADQPKSGQ